MELQTALSASHSEIETFTSCERKHYYSYGLKIHGKNISDSLARGIIGHECLAAYYQGRCDGLDHDTSVDLLLARLDSVVAEMRNDLFNPDEIKQFVFDALEQYFEHYGDEVTENGWEILKVEVRYDAELTPEFILPIVLDLLVRIPGYGVILIDHKFTWNFYDVDRIDLSPQLPRYFAALSALGWKVNGIWYNEIRTQITKANRANPSERFARVPVSLSPNKAVTIMREHMMVATRIGQLRQKGLEGWEQSVVRNTSGCNMCGFNTICAADLDGNDSELILKSFYKEK